ncbi:hypothetical protein SLEP1_g30467 [Rubroshorea leprosula]|uniref:GST N-terminal domain-containing protein n=1 Tax=Rubroshorea leprosula TaxID=152421 RepID=A0AAV5K2K4_9ROSI|nr:hypothetical protein SLEP1_g30467 [Rubroshorea leprosula]
MSKDYVLLLDFWASPFCMRAKVALAEKGVAYEAREEDLFGGKSELLLKPNPICQKVPVLFHNGKPLCESTVISTRPGLLHCSHLVLTLELKLVSGQITLTKRLPTLCYNTWSSKGEAPEEAKREFIDILKQLEGELGEKDFFGGDAFGFVDILHSY